MNTVTLLKNNPAIYNALVNVYGIDLLRCDSVEVLQDDLQQHVDSNHAELKYMLKTQPDDDVKWLQTEIAELKMIKQFIKLLDYYAQPIIETVEK
jgi:hypothetical protein